MKAGRERRRPGRVLARGVVAGAAAWWAMDRALSFLYDREDAAVRWREDRARGGIPALEAMAAEGAAATVRPLSEAERQRAGTALQWTVGIGTGVLYALVRDRLPGSGLGRGLAYGAAVSLVFDEGLVPLLGFAPGPAAFPWQTHARGLAGHLVFGGVAEITLGLLETLENGGRSGMLLAASAPVHDSHLP